MPHDVDYLIVGSGAAGIGAARKLVSLGATPLVLEAMDRVGGRAETRRFDGHRLDLGCGWLHSAKRNAWTPIAADAGFSVDRRAPVWGEQFKNLGFPPERLSAARAAFADWARHLEADPPASDRASDALATGGEWNAYIAAMTGYITGVVPERLSVRDYLTYDAAATEDNWRVAEGYGALIAASLPAAADVRTGMAARSIVLTADGVAVETKAGTIRARTLILTVSTAVLSGDRIRMPAELEPWQAAAAALPLGRNEKLFLEVADDSPFEDETYVLGNPLISATGGYYLRPLGASLIECFLGGDGARVLDDGPEAGFALACDELAHLFGSGVRRLLRPLAASHWHGETWIGGAYSSALPGQAGARARLARPFDDRVFFAGEATSTTDFTTAHGAHDSGVRAAEEATKALARRR